MIEEIVIGVVIVVVGYLIGSLVHTTRIGCFIGIHHNLHHGWAYADPIEMHLVCLKCGRNFTTYWKKNKKKE